MKQRVRQRWDTHLLQVPRMDREILTSHNRRILQISSGALFRGFLQNRLGNRLVAKRLNLFYWMLV